MFYANEDLALKKEDKSPDYIYLPNITKDLCIDEKIKNYIKVSRSYNQENDFVESISNTIINNNIFNNNLFKLNSNEEKEEDFKHYYHSSTTIKNLPLFTKIFVLNLIVKCC